MNKLLLFILFVHNVLCTFAQSKKPILNDKIQYNCREKSLELILLDLSKKKDFKFSFVNNDIPLDLKINIQCDSCLLEHLFQQLFIANQVEYKLIGSQIVLMKSDSVLSTSITNNANSFLGDSLSKKNSPAITNDTLFIITIVQDGQKKRFNDFVLFSSFRKNKVDSLRILRIDTLVSANDTLSETKKEILVIKKEKLIGSILKAWLKINHGNYMLQLGLGLDIQIEFFQVLPI